MFTMWVMILQTSFQNMLLVLHERLLLQIVTSCSFRNLFTFLSLFDSSSSGNENFVENKALLDYSKLSEGAEVVKPSSMALSEFHFLLLLGNKVKVCMHFRIMVLFTSKFPCPQFQFKEFYTCLLNYLNICRL